MKDEVYHDVEIIPFGAWDSKKTLYFGGSYEGTKQVCDTGSSIEVDTLDNMVGESRIDFLKMDIEGSELPALRGASKILSRDMPALAICVYHRASDLLDIPQYIKSFERKDKVYQFFLKKHHLSTESELVLYCIPVTMQNY